MIWKRYFYKEIIKTFAFLLFGIFALYVAIDLMAHLKDIRAGSTPFGVWILYYISTFSRRLDILLPFSVLIGTIRILLAFQMRNELVALLVSGLSMRRLIQPFVIGGLFASLLLYANFQFLLPWAQPEAQYIQEVYFGKYSKNKNASAMHEVILKDGSRLFYRYYSVHEHLFSDVFWVVSLDKVYYMKSLSCKGDAPVAFGVDLLLRGSDGKIQLSRSYQERELTTMKLDEKSLKDSIKPAQDQSLLTLLSQIRLYGKSMSERAIDIRSYFTYKATLPLLCVLASLAPIAYCIRFRRDTPQFMIYLLSLGAMFCFFLLLQVAFVLAKSHVVSPLVALGVPWLAAILAVSKSAMRVVNGTV